MIDWIRTHWQWLLLALAAPFIWLVAYRNRDGLSHIVSILKEESAASREAYETRRVIRKQNTEAAIQRLEEKYEAELDAMRASELANFERLKNDPDALSRELAAFATRRGAAQNDSGSL